MFTTPVPGPPTLSTSTSPVSSSSPPRLGRLRGLSYLRNYTHSHLNPLSGSSSSPAPPSGSRHQHSTSSSNTTTTDGARVSSTHRSNRSDSSVPCDDELSRRSAAAREAETHYTTAVHHLSSRPATMTRNRAETADSTFASQPHLSAATGSGSEASSTNHALPTIRFVPHHDPRASKPSLQFAPITRTLSSPTAVLKVGRYSERETASEERNGTSVAPVGFKSKVVSRRHCEFWCSNSQWYIKDVRSSSGTFLNHIRLSSPGVESKPYPLNDGDIVQLGIDFRGGEEMIFRCVKIRVECNRGWQKGLNAYNKSTHKNLRKLASKGPRHDTDNASNTSSECAICLASIAPCQSLFVAPCSHVWHYKCIRPILMGASYPHFLCPNCRAVADLDADVDEPDNVDWEDDLDAAIEESKKEAERQQAPATPPGETSGSSQAAAAAAAAEPDPAERRADATETGDTTRVPPVSDALTNVPTLTSLSIDQNRLADADELSHVLASVSLSPGPAAAAASAASHSVLAPIPIPASAGIRRSAHPGNDGAGSSDDSGQHLAAGDVEHPECPMTPRNDAGPFLVEARRINVDPE